MKFKETIEEYNTMSVEEKVYFFNKCKEDLIFFIENCCVIPQTGKLVTLYDPQKKVATTFLEDHFQILNKSRQTGGSYITQCICAWLVLLFDNYIIGVVSRSGSESSSYNKKVLDILDNIPQDFMRPHESLDYEERNAQSFKLKKTGSTLVSQAVSPSNPEGILRGNSISLLLIDEAAFISNIQTAFTALIPSTSISQKVAQENNIPYGTFIISTPNGTRGRGEWYFRKWMDAKTGKSVYKANAIYWRDIGLSDKWYKEQCDAFNNDPKIIAQELEMQFISSEGSYWDADVQTKLNELINMEGELPATKEIKYIDGGVLCIYKPDYDRTNFCMMGIDVASASGSDFSTIQIIDFVTCEQIAEYVGKLEPLTFARFVKTIAIMFPNNLIIVENSGGFGITVLNYLADEPENFNIFGETRKLGAMNILKIGKPSLVPGLSTNSKSRPLIIEAMYNHVRENYDTVYSKRLASELMTLVNKNGKIQADDGYNDDLVMAYAFCFYVRKYAPDSYQEILKKLDRGKDVQKDLLMDDSFIDKFYENQDNLAPQAILPGDKYGLKSYEYDQVRKHMKVEENYGLNKFENDYSDVAIDCIFNDDYDDSSDNEEEIYNMLYRNTE
jgi:hypothetical protein